MHLVSTLQLLIIITSTLLAAMVGITVTFIVDARSKPERYEHHIVYCIDAAFVIGLMLFLEFCYAILTIGT